MRSCKASCLHRALVEDYRIARHAQQLAEEAATMLGRGEIADRRAVGIRPITFKEYLSGSAAAPSRVA